MGVKEKIVCMLWWRDVARHMGRSAMRLRRVRDGSVMCVAPGSLSCLAGTAGRQVVFVVLLLELVQVVTLTQQSYGGGYGLRN